MELTDLVAESTQQLRLWPRRRTRRCVGGRIAAGSVVGSACPRRLLRMGRRGWTGGCWTTSTTSALRRVRLMPEPGGLWRSAQHVPGGSDSDFDSERWFAWLRRATPPTTGFWTTHGHRGAGGNSLTHSPPFNAWNRPQTVSLNLVDGSRTWYASRICFVSLTLSVWNLSPRPSRSPLRDGRIPLRAICASRLPDIAEP